MSRSVHSTAISADSATEIRTARQADYVAFLHRAPFVIDATTMGYLTGYREDCSYQQGQYLDLDISVGMLDNDFRKPDLERYIDRFKEAEPRVGVLGDVYSLKETREYVCAVRDLQASYPNSELVIVPKCCEAIDAIPEDLVLGYPRGYSDRLAHEFSDLADWRGRRVHILGGSPRKQLSTIEQLTRPTLAGDPPAQIIGVDWERTPSGGAVRRVLDR